MVNKGRYFVAVAVIAVWYSLRVDKIKESPVISVVTGRLRGQVLESRLGNEFYAFRGIPYAAPPIGPLRFEPTEKAKHWDGIRDATQFGDSCLQPNVYESVSGNEDCLFLNLYTPDLPIDKNVSLPVMVFFHGGIFTFGSGYEYGPEYFMDEDVILVTVNYRLLSFGFLNTGDGTVRGNMGLKDQTMALRWVQENIQRFGGNPGQVTIFGQSAGAASVHLHIVSPMSKGLFQRAISQSGSALSPWAIRSNPEKQAAFFGNKVGCPTENMKSMIACMKKMDAVELTKHHLDMMKPMRDMIKVFVPSVESGPVSETTFLPDHPRTLLRSGQFSKVPWIIGSNSEDGLIGLREIYQSEELRKTVYGDFKKLMPDLLMTKANESAAIIIAKKYLSTEFDVDAPETLQDITAMFNDRWYFNSLQESALLHQKENASVFLYVYSHKQDMRVANFHLHVRTGLQGLWDIIRLVGSKFLYRFTGGDLPYYGVCHIDELLMEFVIPFAPSVKEGHVDYVISREFVKLWADFARGAPLEMSGVPWPEIKSKSVEEFQFLQMSSQPQPLKNPYSQSFEFWNSLNIEPNL